MEACVLDKLLEFGTTFDWISPLIAEVNDMTNGPSHTFLIPEDCGWSGRAVERLLRDHGIKTWGLMIVDHMILITVRQAQARWAQYLLDRERIPIAYGVLDEPTGGDTRQWQNAGSAGPLAVLDGWLEKLESLLEL
jgi:hypothetical protein